jgi:hypothetical protein
MMPGHHRESPRRRQALAGVFVALILFAMLFTVGSTYFLLTSSIAQITNQANATRQALLQQAAAENVALTLSVCGSTGTWCSAHPGSLAISVLNTGGTPVTIAAVYATYNGQNAILPAAPQYLTKPSYLNVTLPITLGVGASTAGMTGCGGTNCNLGILLTALSPATYTLSNPVSVSILTARGNTFSAQYPPIPAVTTITTTTTNAVSSTTITSSAAGGAGGSALVVQMIASPPQSLSGVAVTDSVLAQSVAALNLSDGYGLPHGRKLHPSVVPNYPRLLRFWECAERHVHLHVHGADGGRRRLRLVLGVRPGDTQRESDNLGADHLEHDPDRRLGERLGAGPVLGELLLLRVQLLYQRPLRPHRLVHVRDPLHEQPRHDAPDGSR